ncbi:helix-turn-helix domain-containing protein [Azospirillum doebereinerae]|uniref:Helix-turn-helix domain-containing protein n=1 Tax=Azospirillum doebereinerae TaxID=92933 RepID=A0A3S0V8F1_9PROT|nr:helix-turn-helix domain-containing protein [Azospirillum doebereinerae]RUQ75069.1 helix-turn-helix domain-containing protein [Azospirillum doebereinerae]
MSLRVSALVWRTTLPSGTQKLVAARLADFADDDGGRVFPSNARIARDCSISDRAVREAMRALVAINVLVLVAEERPGQHRPREYRFNLDELVARDEGTNRAEAQAVEQEAEGTTFRAEAPSGRNEVPGALADQGKGDSGLPSSGGSTFRPEGASARNVAPDQGERGSADPLLDPSRVCVVETRTGATSAAKGIIRAFDNARAVAYGEEHRRPHPQAKDLVFAQRWLAAGADVDLCEGVFTAICHTMAERSQSPPAALAFFDQPIADAIVTRNRPMPEGKLHEQRRSVQPVRPSAPANPFQRILDRDLAGCAESA